MKLSCADFSFPLLPHDAALKLISLLGLRGVDIGLFAGRSHLPPETELRRPAKNGQKLRRRLAGHGLVITDVFLQVHENFTDFALNHQQPSRREFTRSQFSRTLEHAAAAGSNTSRSCPVSSMPPAQVTYMTGKIPMKRCGTLEEIADMAAFIVSPEASFTTGFTFDLSGGRATG
jgi:sugar phosphate isomerase/epimerase